MSGHLEETTTKIAIKSIAHNKSTIFRGIVGYSDIKLEFVKALDSSRAVSILLIGPPGCGKSEFLKQIRNHFNEQSIFVDGSYSSKAGIFQLLYDKRPKYVLLDEVDTLDWHDQQALLNLMEYGRLTVFKFFFILESATVHTNSCSYFNQG